MTDKTPLRASLLGLPAEIRQKIFDYVIAAEDGRSEVDLENRWLTEDLGNLVFVHFFEDKPPQLIKKFKKSPGQRLLLISRQCHQEVTPRLYRNEGFYLFNDYDWALWWGTIASRTSLSFELHNTKHPLPDMFGYIKELAFQPTEDVSEEFVHSIERTFPALHTLRAFRHIYLHDRIGALKGVLPLVWIEFHRFLLLAAIVVTKNHSRLKHAKWSDWRFFPDEEEANSIRTMTMKFSLEPVLLDDEVGWKTSPENPDMTDHIYRTA